MDTTDPNVVSYPLSEPVAWYRILQDHGLGELKGARFEVSPHIGEGSLECIHFQEGFWVQQMNFSLKKPLPLLQTASATNAVFIVNFYLTNARMKQQTGEQLFEFYFDNISVMLTSSATTCHYNLPEHDAIKIFQIGFSREWLLANAFNTNNAKLKELFTHDEALFMAENLDYQFKYLVKEMDLKNKDRLFLFSGSLRLLHIFFTKLANRESQATASIHHVDLEHLLQVRMEMDAHPLAPISLEALAQQSGMSLSKFKRYFKQVNGLTPYQYHLQNKMAIGMDRLHENYSVSEVAFLLGYKNLSHFSKAFKKQYGFLPSEVHKKI